VDLFTRLHFDKKIGKGKESGKATIEGERHMAEHDLQAYTKMREKRGRDLKESSATG